MNFWLKKLAPLFVFASLLGAAGTAGAQDYWEDNYWNAGFYDDNNYDNDWYYDYYDTDYTDGWFESNDEDWF